MPHAYALSSIVSLGHPTKPVKSMLLSFIDKRRLESKTEVKSHISGSTTRRLIVDLSILYSLYL